MNPVIVHGGGPQIDDLLKRVGKKGEFIRACASPMPKPWMWSRWLLGGQVNKDIVNLINRNGARLRLTGRTAGSSARASLKVRGGRQR